MLLPLFVCEKHYVLCKHFLSRFYVFGGFGPPREFEVMPKIKVQFVRDNIFHRGWIDQLVYYDIGKDFFFFFFFFVRIYLFSCTSRYWRHTDSLSFLWFSWLDTNQWVWPDTTGPKPTPRAAHSADVTGDKVYIFGGRYREVRMNDLHCLDLLSNAWSGK